MCIQEGISEGGANVRIGAVTIGQSPRTDVAPEFLKAFGGKPELLQCGALDDLSYDEVMELAPKSGDYILVTRMRDGTEVKIAESYIIERMRQCVRRLEEKGVELIVLFCTGEFPDLESSCLILKPDILMEHVIPGIFPKGRLGAVLPSADQIPLLGEKWKRLGLEIEFTAVSPYSGKQADFESAATELKSRGVDLIVLDCMGFNEEIKTIFREKSGLPVILPRTLLGRIASELAGGRL
jgi:protein AroM